MTALCRVCARPMPDQATLCPACVAELEQALAEIPALAEELWITISRQSRVNSNGGRRSAVTPLPFAWDPSVMRNALRNTLATWSRILNETHGGKLPADDIATMALWLLRRVDLLRTHPAADECHDEITACVADCRRIVDRPADRTYAGPCTHTVDGLACGTDLYAKPGAAEVWCRVCGSEYSVEDRQAWMRAELEDHLGSSSYVAMVATGLGVKVSPSTVREWVRRHKLAPRTYAPPRTPGGKPQPLYRVGDIVAVAAGEKLPA